MSADVTPVTTAATTYGDARAADQKAADQKQIDTLSNQNAALITENARLTEDVAKVQADFAAYKAAHPDTPVTPPPTPTPVGTLLGTSLNGPAMKATSAGGLGYTKTTVARVYLRQLPAGSNWTNIPGDGTATSDLKDAIAKATKVIWLSCKETDPALVDAFLKAKPALDQEIWWTHHHEPEDEAPGYSAATFVAEQKVMSPIARKYGCKFATVLMRYTFSAASGRNWQDYVPATLASFIDIFGCDSYNTGNKKQTYSVPSDQIAPIKAAADARKLPWAIGETGAGIFGAAANRAKWASDLAAEATAQKGLAVCWWDQDSYAFDAPTATVWLGKP